MRLNLANYVNRANGNDPPVWSFKLASVFELLDRFIARLKAMAELFETAVEFNKLERVEIGGAKGRTINRCMGEIADSFQAAYREWSIISGKYDLFDMDPAFEKFDNAKRVFDQQANGMERKLAKQLEAAFEDCDTTAQLTKLVLMLGTLLHRPQIREELHMHQNDVVRSFAGDLASVKLRFDEGVANMRTKGMMMLPVDAGQAPVSGVIKWINNLRTQLTDSTAAFQFLDFE